MNREKLRIAIKEAQRFIDRANSLEILIQSQINEPYSSHNPKEQGAVKRSSMDLTRSLAELRRPE